MAAYATLKEQGTMPNHFSYRQVEDAAFRAAVVKRAFDLVFASLVLVFLLSWLIPLIALLIKLDSKGPVFFKQLRT
ncbi:sugar transferase, partial [Hymenobacter crusticola]|uniref:sugar transferase n=1 Tax=Hymenobacter crusticola TaxID=1770526 RepID=UPI0015C50382